MAKYRINVRNNTVFPIEVEANNVEEAIAKAEEITNTDNFMERYRAEAKLNSFRVNMYMVRGNQKHEPTVIKRTRKRRTTKKITCESAFKQWHDALPSGSVYTIQDFMTASGYTENAFLVMKSRSENTRSMLLKDQMTWSTVGVPCRVKEVKYCKK